MADAPIDLTAFARHCIRSGQNGRLVPSRDDLESWLNFDDCAIYLRWVAA